MDRGTSCCVAFLFCCGNSSRSTCSQILTTTTGATCPRTIRCLPSTCTLLKQKPHPRQWQHCFQLLQHPQLIETRSQACWNTYGAGATSRRRLLILKMPGLVPLPRPAAPIGEISYRCPAQGVWLASKSFDSQPNSHEKMG